MWEQITYCDAFLPDSKCPPSYTQNDVTEEWWSLNRVHWAVMDGMVEIRLGSCNVGFLLSCHINRQNCHIKSHLRMMNGPHSDFISRPNDNVPHVWPYPPTYWQYYSCLTLSLNLMTMFPVSDHIPDPMTIFPMSDLIP